ncbi:RAB proteins geranylgeranyltransferase component A (RAB escort protein) [Trachipleistophora hominis]|uniref:RAB proteins geranylgeranyltransferase component A (RAB escort protein) n=1 Tax=Trachipleistophora hominis TaxID=72359 RepID=L7JRZ3_TRAHO|nr:RAB proteins geranylgeranyltransferase component A (RAB escort protein) [Trachipleistophora hominis]
MDFEYGYEGTSAKDLIKLFDIRKKDTIVYDNSDFYGTTSTPLDLPTSKYVKDVQTIKMTEPKCLIETEPQLFRTNGRLLSKLEELDLLLNIDFIEIYDHLYIDENLCIYKVPYFDYEIANSNWLEAQEKNAYFYFVHNGIKYEDFIASMSKRSLQIFNSSLNILTYENCIPNYLSSFGTPPFSYPMYGEREISDQLSRVLSFRNISFYVNKSLKCTRVNDHYEINGIYGNATFRKRKSEANEVVSPVSFYFRVLLLKQPFILPTFFGTIMVDKKIVNVISINCSAKVCPPNTFLVYFYADHKLPAHLMSHLKIDENNILNDVTFSNMREFNWSFS